MQRATARWAQACALLGLALVLLTTWSTLPLDPTSTGGAALALVVLAAAALRAVLPRRGPGLGPAPAGHAALRRDRLTPSRPSRQCDPDAAGHPRPRAPGRV